MYYLATIRREGLSWLMRYGRIILAKGNMERIELLDSDVCKDKVRKLLSLADPFEYSAEYLFLSFLSSKAKRAMRDVGQLEIGQIVELIPFDKGTCEEFEFSFYKKLRFA